MTPMNDPKCSIKHDLKNTTSCSECFKTTPEQSNEETVRKFDNRFVKGHGPIYNADQDIQEAESWIEATPEEMKDFLMEILQAKDSYWKGELKRVVESVPDTEVEPYALANGFRRQFEDGYNCAIDKVQTWKTEQLKNLNGI